MVEVDKETEKQMNKIRQKIIKLGKENMYNQLPLESLIFLNKREKFKRRKKSDWLEYFLEGFELGAKHWQSLIHSELA